MSETVYLVDALPYVFRAYFSIPSSMQDKLGNPVGAVYGYTGFLVKLIAEHRPSHLMVAFDRSLNTSFRNDFYPGYKAQRELPPPELEAQLEACEAVSEALGARTVADQRYEADDLIGTAARQLEHAGHPVVVVTCDKDMCQLVNDRTTVFDVAKDVRLAAPQVFEKLGVRPEQVPDFLGLAGDAVDNIPGVKGIGAKTATALLAAFPDLEALYDRLEEVPTLPLRGAKSIVAKLAAGREMAFLSRKLATISHEAPITATLDWLRYEGPVADKVEPLFTRLGFEGIKKRVLALRAS